MTTPTDPTRATQTPRCGPSCCGGWVTLPDAPTPAVGAALRETEALLHALDGPVMSDFTCARKPA